MATKIGWFLDDAHPWNELLYLKPEPLDLYKGHKAQYVRCPALTHYCKNTFVIRSGVDMELRYDEEQKKIKYVDGSMEPWIVKEMLVQFHPNEWKENTYPIFQIQLQNGFVADEPVWMEAFQPFHDAPDIPGIYLPGTFDIFSWQRMISYGFEWRDLKKNFKVKRGDPLTYVRFRSEDPGADFKIQPIEMTDKLKKDIAKCQGAKFPLRNYSWRLMKLNRKLRPRRYIK